MVQVSGPVRHRVPSQISRTMHKKIAESRHERPYRRTKPVERIGSTTTQQRKR